MESKSLTELAHALGRTPPIDPGRRGSSWRMPVRSTEFQGLAADTDTSGGPVADADRAERKQSRPPVYDAWRCCVQPNAEQPVARTSAASARVDGEAVCPRSVGSARRLASFSPVCEAKRASDRLTADPRMRSRARSMNMPQQPLGCTAGSTPRRTTPGSTLSAPMLSTGHEGDGRLLEAGSSASRAEEEPSIPARPGCRARRRVTGWYAEGQDRARGRQGADRASVRDDDCRAR